MGLLKNKVLILIIGAVVLLLIAAIPGYKVFSLYSFNTFTKELDSGNKDLFASFKTEVAVSNKIAENLLKSSDFGAGFSKETNTKYINQAKTDYDKSLKDYKKGIEELESKAGDLANFAKLPLWLDSNQKKFAGDFTLSIDQYLEARKADYQFQIKTKPVLNNVFQILDDTIALLSYSNKLANAETEEDSAKVLQESFSEISSLEKYSKTDYKFEGENNLASEFTDSYKAFGVIKGTYGQFYLVFKAMSEGDYSKVDELTQVGLQFKDSLGLLDNPFNELGEKSKPYLVKIKDSYVNYAEALDFFASKNLHSNLLSKEKVLAQNNQNKLVVFTYLVELYYLDNGKYPTDTNFSFLVTTLKNSNRFDNTMKYNESDFTYASPKDSYFEIGHKDEISGQTSKIVVGVKEDTTTTLGASVQAWTIKVKDKEIKLEFVGDLIDSFESWLPPRL